MSSINNARKLQILYFSRKKQRNEKSGKKMKKSEPERPFVYTTKDTLGNMVCNKTSGNDGFASEFYGTFWSELKTPLLVRYKKRFFA